MRVIIDAVLLIDFTRVRTLRKYKKLSRKKIRPTILPLELTLFMIKDEP